MYGYPSRLDLDRNFLGDADDNAAAGLSTMLATMRTRKRDEEELPSPGLYGGEPGCTCRWAGWGVVLVRGWCIPLAGVLSYI